MQEPSKYQIGQTLIPYTVVERPRLVKKRLVLTPYDMEVRVPKGTPESDIGAFLLSKQKWIIQSWDELRSKVSLDAFPERFGPGSKVMKWGRFVRLNFVKTPEKKIIVSGGAPIQIGLPTGVKWEDKESEIADAVSSLLVRRLKDAISKLISQHSESIASPKAWVISRSSDKWGYCSPDGNLGFHWQLICCPKSVLEYVVVHELTHLLERSHSDKFWSKVKKVLPNYESQKKWLEVEGARISANHEP